MHLHLSSFLAIASISLFPFRLSVLMERARDRPTGRPAGHRSAVTAVGSVLWLHTHLFTDSRLSPHTHTHTRYHHHYHYHHHHHHQLSPRYVFRCRHRCVCECVCTCLPCCMYSFITLCMWCLVCVCVCLFVSVYSSCSACISVCPHDNVSIDHLRDYLPEPTPAVNEPPGTVCVCVHL